MNNVSVPKCISKTQNRECFGVLTSCDNTGQDSVCVDFQAGGGKIYIIFNCICLAIACAQFWKGVVCHIRLLIRGRGTKKVENHCCSVTSQCVLDFKA